jgi:hypothetical protein
MVWSSRKQQTDPFLPADMGFTESEGKTANSKYPPYRGVRDSGISYIARRMEKTANKLDIGGKV